MRSLFALPLAVLGLTLVGGCSNGTANRSDHAATHPDPDPVTTPPPVNPPPVTPPPVDPPPVTNPPPPPWNGGTPEPGMVIHLDVGTVLGVSVDEGANVWTVDGQHIWLLEPGKSWRSFDGSLGQASVGQLARGFAAQTICGGEAGKAYVGYYAHDLDDPMHSTPEQRSEGDLDRVALDASGNLTLEHHYEIHNNNGADKKTFDETRSILTCIRVNDGPNKGDLYTGSNHGLTLIRGDSYGDHRHPTFDYPSCPAPTDPAAPPPAFDPAHPCDDAPEAIGYVWNVNLNNRGYPLMAAEWMFAEVPPNPDMIAWTLKSYAWSMVGPPLYPLPNSAGVVPTPSNDTQTWLQRWPLRFEQQYRAGNRAIAQTPDGRYWLGSQKYGLVWFEGSGKNLKRFVEVDGEPGVISALIANADGSLWVGTRDNGLWKYTPPQKAPLPSDPTATPAPETGTWIRVSGIPGANVTRLHSEMRSGKQQLFIGTNAGLAVYTPE